MKQITYRELLNLIHEWKQHKRIVHNDRVYKFKNNTYFEESKKEEIYYLTYAIRSHTERYLAEYREFSYEETILDDKEKEYLSNVIKPFKNYVKCIVKIEIQGQEEIRILYKDFLDKEKDDETQWYSTIGLPTFKKGTMYKGMETKKRYTLEELGL